MRQKVYNKTKKCSPTHGICCQCYSCLEYFLCFSKCRQAPNWDFNFVFVNYSTEEIQLLSNVFLSDIGWIVRKELPVV